MRQRMPRCVSGAAWTHSASCADLIPKAPQRTFNNLQPKNLTHVKRALLQPQQKLP
jgi:hypothetical protein